MITPTPDDILDTAGLSADALTGGDWPLEAVRATVRRLRELLVGEDSLVRELCRDGAIRRLRAVVDSPARIVDAALQEMAAEDSGAELEDCETYGGGIVDIVADGSSQRPEKSVSKKSIWAENHGLVRRSRGQPFRRSKT